MTREEAINKIRQMRLPKETMEILEALAPELSESEGERILASIADCVGLMGEDGNVFSNHNVTKVQVLAYLEKQKEASKAIEAVERIDKYIDENLANAHDMKDSNPDKKYYRGWDDALGEMARILQDVYSDEKQKESLRDFIDDFPYSAEQKPAEWSEEDEHRRTDAIYFLESAKSHYADTSEIEKTILWFKSLRPRLSDEEIKKIRSEEYTKGFNDAAFGGKLEEWSKEDEKMRKGLINFLRSSFIKENITDETVAPWIAYLERQKAFVTIPAIEIVKNEPMEMPSGKSLDALADVVQAKDWKSSEEQKYDGNMDKECIKLCYVLNSIPSIDTFESCCGHLKDRYSIWFYCNDVITISRLGRSVERNYSDGKWELVVDSTDTHPTGVFWLRSKVPFQDYDEMEESVNELCVGIQYWFNAKFDSYFNGDSCK